MPITMSYAYPEISLLQKGKQFLTNVFLQNPSSLFRISIQTMHLHESTTIKPHANKALPREESKDFISRAMNNK